MVITIPNNTKEINAAVILATRLARVLEDSGEIKGETLKLLKWGIKVLNMWACGEPVGVGALESARDAIHESFLMSEDAAQEVATVINLCAHDDSTAIKYALGRLWFCFRADFFQDCEKDKLREYLEKVDVEIVDGSDGVKEIVFNGIVVNNY